MLVLAVVILYHLPFVTQMHCNKTAKARIMRLSLKAAQFLTSLLGKFDSVI